MPTAVSADDKLGGGAAITLKYSSAAGALGCLVRLDQQLCILSSGHVLTRFGQTTVGDGVYEVGAGGTLLAKVIDAAAPDPTDTSTVYGLDAALAEVTDPELVTANIGKWGPPKGSSGVGNVNDRVFVWGAVSPRSNGRIIDPNWSGQLRYSNGQLLNFAGLVQCTRYSRPGDSGSIVLNDDMKIVGLHIAGDDDHSFFCPVSAVTKRWKNLKFVT